MKEKEGEEEATLDSSDNDEDDDNEREDDDKTGSRHLVALRSHRPTFSPVAHAAALRPQRSCLGPGGSSAEGGRWGGGWLG